MDWKPSSGEDMGSLAEINVTPLVDVMLVLLIIFIITAPMLVQGVKVNLPKQNAASIASKKQEPIVLTLTADRLIYPFTSSSYPSGSGPNSGAGRGLSTSKPTQSCRTVSWSKFSRCSTRSASSMSGW